MISLDVENYCHECSKFYYGDGHWTTLISCENKGVCENIKLYIEQQMAKKENKS